MARVAVAVPAVCLSPLPLVGQEVECSKQGGGLYRRLRCSNWPREVGEANTKDTWGPHLAPFAHPPL